MFLFHVQAEGTGTIELDESLSESMLCKLKKEYVMEILGTGIHSSQYLFITYILPFSFLGSMIKQQGLDCVTKPCGFISVWQGLSDLKDDLMLVLGS